MKKRETSLLFPAIRLAVLDQFRLHFGYRAAALSFYAISTMIPLIVVLATILSLLPIETRTVVEHIYRVLPKTPMGVEAIMSLLSEVLKKQRGIYGLVGFVLAYYFASTLFLALHRTMCLVFEEPRERREHLMIQLSSVPIFMLGLFAVNLGAIAISVSVKSVSSIPFISTLLPERAIFLIQLSSNVSLVITFFTFFLLLFLMYHFMTPRTKPSYKNSFIVTGLISLLFTWLKSLFGSLFSWVALINPIYGAFSGIFGFLAWIFLSFDLILIGARIFFYLERPRSAK